MVWKEGFNGVFEAACSMRLLISSLPFEKHDSLVSGSKVLVSITLASVILKRFELIGFLIAAKSIFRYGGIKKSTSRKEVEYILIGTLSSFVIAILVGLFAKWVI